jgi:hypothetical protein
MDYKRIYEELIEHRKMMPKLEGVYYERHHIVPRCMGGGDEEENLIWLTGEDHYMAHLLLAKAYNTKSLWYGVVAMEMPVQGVQKVKHRRMIATARRKAAEASTKNEARTWVRVEDGKEFYRTRTEMRDEFGLSLHTTALLVLGYHKTSRGFYLKGTDLTKKGSDQNEYEFRNVKTGEVVKCTRQTVMDMWGLTIHDVWNLVKGVSKFAKGVCLASTPDIPPKRLDGAKYKIKHIESGEVFTLTRAEFTKKFKLPVYVINHLVDRVLKQSNGFCLDETVDLDKPADIHDFRIIATGEVVSRTVTQLAREFEVPKHGIKSLVAGKFVHYYGICMNHTSPDDPRLKIPARNQVYTLQHKETGEIIVGTSKELAKYGLNRVNLSGLARGIGKSHLGYVLISRENPSFNRRVPSNNSITPRPDYQVESQPELPQASSQLALAAQG